MSSKLSVSVLNTSKVSVASATSRKAKCSVACSAACSGSEDNIYEPEFIIHKEDFLIFNKKVSSFLILVLVLFLISL